MIDTVIRSRVVLEGPCRCAGSRCNGVEANTSAGRKSVRCTVPGGVCRRCPGDGSNAGTVATARRGPGKRPDRADRVSHLGIGPGGVPVRRRFARVGRGGAGQGARVVRPGAGGAGIGANLAGEGRAVRADGRRAAAGTGPDPGRPGRDAGIGGACRSGGEPGRTETSPLGQGGRSGRTEGPGGRIGVGVAAAGGSTGGDSEVGRRSAGAPGRGLPAASGASARAGGRDGRPPLEAPGPARGPRAGASLL